MFYFFFAATVFAATFFAAGFAATFFAAGFSLAERIVAFIRNPMIVKYLIVTIPEALGVKLTERVIGELENNQLKVENIIINNVVKDSDCEFHRIRSAMQSHYIDLLENTYKDKNVTVLHCTPYEIKGEERIKEISRALFP